MRLGSLTRPELIFPDLPATDRAGVLHALAERIAGRGAVPNAVDLYQKLLEREQLGSTGIGAGIAIPHCKLPGLQRGVVAIGLMPQGVDFGAVDGQPVNVFFLVVSPSDSPAEHLQVLAAISRWVKADRHAERVLGLHDADAVYDFLQEEGG
ncbi:MAG TPA: PTS sugar transporter subunit IIA [Thermoanaerobaculia bacterium]|nr:PTS sugar transporter subunit IIA [Thermoanaerobaculia bacterium]